MPALSIALVDDQAVVWAKGFGFANPKEKVPATDLVDNSLIDDINKFDAKAIEAQAKGWKG